MVGGNAKRVLCLTCNKQHNYRKAKPDGASTPASKAGKKAPAAPKVTGTAREWQANVGDRDSAEFLPYSIHTTFETGQLVNHPKFGSGYVKETLASQKLCVLFKDGPRTLVHGRS